MNAITECDVKAITLEDVARQLNAKSIPYAYSAEDAFDMVVYSGVSTKIIAAKYSFGQSISYASEFKHQRKCLAHLKNSQLDLSSKICSELAGIKILPESRKIVKAGGTASAYINIYVPSFEELVDFIAEHYSAGL